MTFTTTLPAGIELPGDTWVSAAVRRRGGILEISTGASSSTEPSSPAPNADRLKALEEWLALSASRPACILDDESLDDLRWETLKAKYHL